MNKDMLKTEMMIEHLILQNALEIDGVDPESGEMIYSITDKLEEVNPQLYKNLKKDFEAHMFRLIDEGPKVMRWKLNDGF